MRSLTKTNQLIAAASNRRLVVQLLRDQPQSRRQLAERTGLQNSSVTYIVRDLMDQGIIRAVCKVARSGVGKKQIQLEVNPELGWVVGIGVENEAASLIYMDTSGCVLERDRFFVREPFRMLPQVLHNRVEGWMVRRNQSRSKFLGMGVGVSGIVDNQLGVLLRSAHFQVENWPLKQKLEEEFHTRIRIDNDSKMAILAEVRMGAVKGAWNLIYFLLNVGEAGQVYHIRSLGSSLCIDGKIYRGSHFSAGEIDLSIARNPFDPVTAEQLLAIARGDGAFSDDLRRIADRALESLVPLVDLIDPTSVVLGGNLNITNRQMLAYLQDQLVKRVLPIPGRHVTIRPSTFADYDVAMGSAVAALDAVLNTEEEVLSLVHG